LTAVEQPYPVSFRQVLLQPVQWARRYLGVVRAKLVEAGFSNVDATVLAGEVVPAIEAHAEVVEPTLVVMATHGRGNLSRLWLGSVTDGLIRRSSWPVLVVRPGDEAGPARLDEVPGIERILVALDGSTTSEAILETAVRVREVTGAHLTVLRVVQFPPEDPPPFYRGPGPVDPAILDGLVAEAHAYVDRIVDDLVAKGAAVAGVVEVAERPTDAILEAIETHRVDLVALGTQGRGALPRFVVGSVADQVVRRASVPVLLVRRKKSE
jgi:nucleotide-binding universal stress UspA family protein